MLATRARGDALVVVASCTLQSHRNGKRPLSIGARPWCDVPAAVSNAQPAFVWRSRERATAVAVSLKEARHARPRRARAVPRWLWSLYAPYKATAPVRGLSTAVQDRAATC